MTSYLRHRGPDDSGVAVEGAAALGHRRLSIIDLSSRAHQPMADDGGQVWLTFNGEIFNYRELRRELESLGHTFASQSDTEVLLRSYLEWGSDCLTRLIGMFAFAIWDARDSSMLLARDPLGIKPLFYSADAKRLVFASELQALLRTGAVEPKLSIRGLRDVLVFAADIDPNTSVDGVEQLPPAHAVRFQGTSRTLWRYWSPLPPRYQFDSEAEWINGFRSRVEEGISKAMVADVPIGIFLSGGLDSNTIAETVRRRAGQPVKAFIMGFPEPAFDESALAEANARFLDLEPVLESPRHDNLADLIVEVVTHSGEITPNSSFVATWHLAARAAQDVKVVLSGDGPDELLCGYDTQLASLIARPLGRLVPAFLWRRLSRLADGLPGGLDYRDWRDNLRRFCFGILRNSEDRHGVWRAIVRLDDFPRLLTPDLWTQVATAGDPVAESYGRVLAEAADTTALRRLSYADTMIYLPNDGLVKMDRVAMAHGLEVRVPFLNHDLVEYMMAMPDSLKRRWLTRKVALRRIMAGRLNPAIFRARKVGFRAPSSYWINGPAKDLLYDTTRPAQLRADGLFNPDYVENLLTQHRNGLRDHSDALWVVMATSLWKKAYGISL